MRGPKSWGMLVVPDKYPEGPTVLLGKENSQMALDEDLIQILRCPKCKGELQLDEAQTAFDCLPCKLRYPVVDDIPNFLIDEALPLEAQS